MVSFHPTSHRKLHSSFSRNSAALQSTLNSTRYSRACKVLTFGVREMRRLNSLAGGLIAGGLRSRNTWLQSGAIDLIALLWKPVCSLLMFTSRKQTPKTTLRNSARNTYVCYVFEPGTMVFIVPKSHRRMALSRIAAHLLPAPSR